MKKLKGLYTALITPFTQNNKLDEDGLRHLIHRQLAENIEGIVLMGSTGEAPTLTDEEKRRIITIGKEEIGNSCKLIIGTGSYSTEQTILDTQEAAHLGADAALIVVPYYNRPSQEGLYLHFKTVAEASKIPIIIYNVPGRTGSNLLVETLVRLAEIPSIVALKDCSANVLQISESIALTKQIRDDFSILSGDDAITLPLMVLGGDGLLSVASNLLPKEVKELVDAATNHDFAKAKELHHQLMPFFKAIFVETNPIPIKKVLELCGLPSGPCRLPLCEPSLRNIAILTEIAQQYYPMEVNR